MAIEIAPQELALPETRSRLRDRRALRRLCGWGGSAAIALAAVAIATQTESGAERLQLAFEGPPPHAAVAAAVPARAVEKDPETRRLEAQLSTLAADRDRLTARLASLEHSLDDVTGSIKRQAALAAAAPPAPPPSAPPPAPQIASTPPAVSAPAAEPAPTAPSPAAPASTGIAIRTEAAPTQAAAPVADLVPLPPVRVATAAASEPAFQPTTPPKLEFGVDLGGAASVDALRAHWAGVKANYGPLLAGLSPVATRNRHTGSPEYRLVVGPLPNAAAAVRLCAQFAAARTACRPAKFDGERIAQR